MSTIGAGREGGALGALFVKAGHPVMFSSRHPDTLKGLVDELGPLARAGTVAEAVEFGDVVMVVVPYTALESDEQMFFIANPINRYSMSLRTNPKFEPDGSLVIYIQNESPGPDKEANCLPAPKGKFHLMLRLYWPDESDPSILDGTWPIPPVTQVQ